MSEEKEVNYLFIGYYKYGFNLLLEDGTVISNEQQNSDDIYRFSIGATGTAIKKQAEDGSIYYEVDRLNFVKI